MPNGDVTACGPITFTHAGFVAGNVRRERLRTLWCDSAYFTALRDLGRRDFPGVCGRCAFWETCRGSCRAYAWSRGGSWVAPYPLCQVFAERYPDQARDRVLPGGAAEEPR
jgi:radical SAM protein with 4Fe4S-binding SPASM domain